MINNVSFTGMHKYVSRGMSPEDIKTSKKAAQEIAEKYGTKVEEAIDKIADEVPFFNHRAGNDVTLEAEDIEKLNQIAANKAYAEAHGNLSGV